MKKLFIILLMFSIGCRENEKKVSPSEDNLVKDLAAPTSETPEKAFLCFFSTENENQARSLRDSIILNLEVTEEVVTGTLNWIPAEKDSRRGEIQATMIGDEVKGDYSFIQEGIQDTISIVIQLHETSASITTFSRDGHEMKLEAQRVDCR